MKLKLIILIFLFFSFYSFSQTGCILGDCLNGQGTYVLSNGDKYIGDFKDGAINGHGIYYYLNGDKYEGEWKNGKTNGQGIMTWINGDIYNGNWKDSNKDGQGSMIWSNGQKYIGQWLNNQFNGFGTLVDVNGVIYEGEFKNGIQDGHGKSTMLNGDCLNGEFKNGVSNGQCTIKYSNGIILTSEFKNGHANGQGTLNYPSGVKYIGEFKDDKFNGQGTYLWTDGRKYEGEFKDDKFNGKGILTYNDGEKYIGEWTNNKKNGLGTLSWSNGNNITAEWKDNVPIIKVKNDNINSFAVVIGNKNYKSTKIVTNAINDAEEIKNYLIYILGYKEGNIFYIEDATKSTFETYFGTKENPQGKLFNNIKQEISDVFIYYSGHGAPGLKDNKGYFVPIDCDPQYVELGGYSLDLFYNNLSKLKAKSITVVTDACFSGAEIINNISPITLKINNPILVANNCVILSSSTGSQVSSWYNVKKHGLFTYFFLRALLEKDKSDKNKDGKLTFQEIFDYISDKTEGVPYYSRSINGVEQTPTIQGTGTDNIFIEYK